MSDDKKTLVLDLETSQEIFGSIDAFDMNAPLTEEEVRMMGQVVGKPQQTQSFVPAHDIEDDTFEENVEPVNSESDYNALYAYYLKCQSVVTLIDFAEGWEAFKELVLKPFVKLQKQENKEYRGTSPNMAFALRTREQAAEDFMEFITARIDVLKQVPKPVLKQQK